MNENITSIVHKFYDVAEELGVTLVVKATTEQKRPFIQIACTRGEGSKCHEIDKLIYVDELVKLSEANDDICKQYILEMVEKLNDAEARGM